MDATAARDFNYGSSPITPYTPLHHLPSQPPNSTSHPPQEFVLAPDSKGNPIPANAKWTQVTRRLISPEILEQRGMRYEARPEWVAILGELRKEEISELALASAWVRSQRERGPERPPRPAVKGALAVPIPIPGERKKVQRTYSTTESESDPSYSGSNGESDDEKHRSNSRHGHGNRRYRKKTPGYQGSDIGIPMSGYPNPLGQPVAPPSPTVSFVSAENGNGREKGRDGDRERGWDGMPRSAPAGVRFSESPMGSFAEERTRKSSEKEREKGGERPKERDRERERERQREPDRAFYTYASPISPSQSHRERDPREREKERSEPRRYRDENYGYNHDGHGGERRKSSYRETEYSHHRDGKERRKDRDREGSRGGGGEKARDREGSRGGEKARDREGSRGGGKGRNGSSSSRWKENLTAAGIGGAAVSLLNVLSEAAEGL